MKKDDLKRLLQETNVPEDSYSLDGGLTSDTLCLDKTSRAWTVYYTEMGKKYNEIGFPSEDDACDYFYKEVVSMIPNIK